MEASKNIDPQIIILMGVSGSGKTTVGKLLAKNLGWSFYEGDDFHPRANIAKMIRGVPLSDEDRQPWLAALKQLIQRLSETSQRAIITCSALKQAYRDFLAERHPGVTYVYLKGNEFLIRQRLLKREMHFMKDDLLASQLEVLEEPQDALTLNVALTPEFLVEQIKQELKI